MSVNKRRVSIVRFFNWKIARCKSENHVPDVAVSKESRIPDVTSKVSADRL